MGVADRKVIPDGRMTASTYYSGGYYPYYGRLNGTRGDGAWCTRSTFNRTDCLQVDMGAVRSVCAMATQGHRTGDNWVASYKLHLSIDGVTWNTYKENISVKVSK